MAQDNIQAIVQTYFDTFNASDVDGMLALLHDDVAHDINQGDRQIGKEAFRLHYATAIQHFNETRSDVTIMVSPEYERAAAEFTRRGSYTNSAEGLPPANGQSYSLPAALFFEVDEGLITRITGYFNKANFVRQLS